LMAKQLSKLFALSSSLFHLTHSWLSPHKIHSLPFVTTQSRTDVMLAFCVLHLIEALNEVGVMIFHICLFHLMRKHAQC
jgi:hypothetical protein